MRLMYDAIHDNVGKIRSLVKAGDLVAGYVTGSPDIRWTPADMAVFNQTDNQVVTIDQGFTGSPVGDAMVRDVEPNAWTAHNAVNEPWNTPRPTIYCDRSDLFNYVIPAGWKGDVWLAIPEPMPTSAPHYPNVNVVAVQFGFERDHDVSIIFDQTWPNLPIIQDVLSVTGHAGYANFGWTHQSLVSKSELVIKGAGGMGTGTDYFDMIINGDAFHSHVNMAPGWYLARVRGFSFNSVPGPWSKWHKFHVDHP